MLATNFTQALVESGVSPKAIAEACDITEQAVSNWKRSGKIANQHLAKIAALTGWSVSRLLTGHEPATSAAVAANEPSVFEVMTKEEHELLDDFRAMMDDDQIELRALIAERARRARAYLERMQLQGVPLIAKTVAERRASSATSVTPAPRHAQLDLLDDKS